LIGGVETALSEREARDEREEEPSKLNYSSRRTDSRDLELPSRAGSDEVAESSSSCEEGQ
jgi:hypothetical protein